jgi:hypothetical protein
MIGGMGWDDPSFVPFGWELGRGGIILLGNIRAKFGMTLSLKIEGTESQRSGIEGRGARGEEEE